MPEYIGAEVTTLRNSTSDAELTLLLGVAGDRDEFASCVEAVGATVNSILGQATLREAPPVSAIDRRYELEGLVSSEIEREDVRTLDGGNGRSRRRVTRSSSFDCSFFDSYTIPLTVRALAHNGGGVRLGLLDSAIERFDNAIMVHVDGERVIPENTNFPERVLDLLDLNMGR